MNHFITMRTKKLIPIACVSILALAMTFAVSKAIDPEMLDKKIRPQDDFFEYVNSIWISKNPIPATETSWGNFNALNDASRKALRSICEESANNPGKSGSEQQQIGDFYASGMDSMQIEKMKFVPLKPEFDLINSVGNSKDIAMLISQLHKIQISSGFGYFVLADQKNSNLNVGYLAQDGFGLPDRDYYRSADFASLRDEYKNHLKKMFSLMGDDDALAQKNADFVFELESKLADSSMTAVEQRDPEKLYNKMTEADLDKLAPNMPWSAYFQAMKTPNPGNLIVMQPAFLRQFSALLQSENVNAWKAYFRWQLVHGCAGKLHQDIVNENFRFYGTVMSGQKTIQERWKRILGATEGALGEAMGKIYVQKNFSEKARSRVNEMVTNLVEAYRERIGTRTWMSMETKQKALEKLNAITRKLGFPDKWRDYNGLKIDRSSFVRNFLNSNAFDVNYFLSRINKPVDKVEWGMTPATVNAYYNPQYNEIVFPAAIMQSPFFDANADDAVNYGAIGAVIGHELTHGFDDEGSQYDAEGNLRDWWTADDRKKFEELTSKLVQQFNNYTVIDSIQLKINGELTTGENIADLGGLTISYYAYQRSLQGKGKPAAIDGFTGEQRFFISWAQAWRNSMRAKSLINMVKTNPHSPAKYRVIGPLSNMKEFYDAFGVKPGDKMYKAPEERAEIW
jgi:putative endopeptidase